MANFTNILDKLFFYFKKLILLKFDQLITLEIGKKKKAGIVLIKLDAIGDFVIWLDTAKEYRRIYPNLKITLVANIAWASMAREMPYWDDVWAVNINDLEKKALYRWSILRKVRRANFDIAIQPTFSRAIIFGDSLVRATCSNHRIGSVGDTSNISFRDKAVSDKWYTKLIPASSKPMMELLRNAEFINNLTGQNFIYSLPKYPAIGALPNALNFNNYAILFPSASRQARRWPKDYFVELGERLHHQYGWQILFCGASSDYSLCESAVKSASINCINLAGKTTLSELAELIRGARLLISNETSAVHIAAAVDTPCVCIMGGGHYGRFLPYPNGIAGVIPLVATKRMSCFNCNWKCNQPHDPTLAVPCIKDIPVAEVLGLVPQALAQLDI
jgi:ADP-heptose:LPS heptosyltransferase